MKVTAFSLCGFLFWVMWPHSIADLILAEPDLQHVNWNELSWDQLKKMNNKVADVESLVNEADLVISGTPSLELSAHSTTLKVDRGDLVVFVQKFKVNRVLFGREISSLNLIRPGVEPLPPADDPINRIYPGPLAENVEYVLFLKQIQRHDYYVIGVWQGVYPLGPDQKTIALLEEGFTSLHNLTVDELEKKLLKIKERNELTLIV
jgi:hypothetical protein